MPVSTIIGISENSNNSSISINSLIRRISTIIICITENSNDS